MKRGIVRNVLTLILAGGKGTRLEPLTRDRAKPAVPFGGLYRIIDFTLSNCLNSDLRRILVLTQYKARSLDRHIASGWSFLSRELDEYIDVLPPQQRLDETWYQGTADAIYQNIYTIEKANPKFVLILAGDHIYKMDYGNMIRAHIERDADLTVGCLPVPAKESVHFGVMQVDASDRIVGFREKPKDPLPIPGDPEHVLASMGIYVFTARLMFELLCQDATKTDSNHDFGKNIIPNMIDKYKVFGYRFRDKNQKPNAYWRDVGTLDAYFQANMDLVQVVPELNLYDQGWPIRTYQPHIPPPKFVFRDETTGRRGEAHDSIVCAGCIVSGGQVVRSILSPNVRINSFAQVEDSILFSGVDVGRGARIRRAIIDKDVKIPRDAVLGYDLEHDRRRGLTVTDQGIVVVSKGELPDTFKKP
ncbi:MAG: glucose-1-phosphate adenylyltransferase [Planctomycetes bacterium]|nr:glucose-1-phosphate adenylyltransferase [Planctomycetota bacterium]